MTFRQNRYATPMDRVRANSEPSGECWLWKGKKDRDGYGCITVYSKERKRPITLRAHRFAYVHSGHDLSQDMTIDHVCGNRSCVNPGHLEPVTMHENLRRAGRYRPDGTCGKCGKARERSAAGLLVCRPCGRANSNKQRRVATPVGDREETSAKADFAVVKLARNTLEGAAGTSLEWW